MIFHCPACRELATATQAVIEDGGARAGVLCPACGHVAWLEASSAPAAARGTASEGTPRASSSEPSRPDEALVRAVSLAAGSPTEEPLVKELIALTSRWSDYDAHRALLGRAQALGALPALGVRYRRVLDARPDDEIAKRAQQEIVTLAMASLSTMPGVERESESATAERQRLLALALTGVFLVGTLVIVVYFLGRL